MESPKKPLPKSLARLTRVIRSLDEFTALGLPPVIYFLLGPSDEPGANPEEEVVLYVGRSTNLVYRLRSHSVDKSYDRVVVIPMSTRDLRGAEAAFIDFLTPPLNGKDFKRPADEVVARAASYLGLVDDGTPTPPTEFGLATFKPEDAGKLWYRLKTGARSALLLVAKHLRYTQKAGFDPHFNFRSLNHVGFTARRVFRAQPPYRAFGPTGRRTYSMEPAMASAFLRAARKYGV